MVLCSFFSFFYWACPRKALQRAALGVGLSALLRAASIPHAVACGLVVIYPRLKPWAVWLRSFSIYYLRPNPMLKTLSVWVPSYCRDDKLRCSCGHSPFTIHHSPFTSNHSPLTILPTRCHPAGIYLLMWQFPAGWRVAVWLCYTVKSLRNI